MQKSSYLSSALLVVYSMFEIVDSRIQKLAIFLQVFRIYQFVLITYCCLRGIFVSPVYNSAGVFIDTIRQIDNFLTVPRPFQILYLVFVIMCVVLIILLLIVKYRITSNTYIEVMAWSCTIICLIFRILWFWVIQQTLLTLTSSTNQYPIIGYFRFPLLFFPIISICYMHVVFRKQYIYGIFHSFIPVSLFLDESNYLLLLLLSLTCLVINFLDKNNMFISYINSMMFVVVWTFIRTFLTELQPEQLILVLAGFLLTVIHHFYRGKSIQQSNNKNKQIFRIKQFFNKQKDIKFQTQVQLNIVSGILTLYTNIATFSLQQQQHLQKMIKLKDVNKIEKETHFVNLQLADKFKKQMQDSFFQLFIYDIRLSQSKDHYKCLLTIFKLYHAQSSFNFMYKYQLSKLLIKIENWFITQNNNQEANNNYELESSVSKFYDDFQKCLKFLLEVWMALGNDIVDFEKIWINFTQVLKLRKQLQKQLNTTVNRYKRIQQLVKYNHIMTMFNFPKFNVIPVQTLTINTQPRASYLKVCDDKIISQSQQFCSLFNFKDDELNQVDFNKLSPLKNSLLLNLEIIENLKVKDNRCPIIDAHKYLNFVHMQAYLQPMVLGKIQYIIFITPIYVSSEAYILYNVQTDEIEEASKGFADDFGIDVSLLHTFAQKPIIGKDIFSEINFHSNDVIKQLTSDSGLFSEINMSSVTLDHSTEIVKVFVRIIQTFNDNNKKYLIKIQKQRNRDKNFEQGTVHLQNQQTYSIFTKQLEKDKTFYQIIDKKANLNTAVSGNDIVSIAYVLIGIICTLFCIITFYYSYNWFKYLVQYIEGINQRSVSLLDIFFQSFNLMHISNWPPTQLSNNKILSMKQFSQEQLQRLLFVIQQQTINSLVTISLPFVSRNIQQYGYSLQSTHSGLDLFFNIVYSTPLIYTQPLVMTLIQNYHQSLEFAIQQNFIHPYEKLLFQFQTVSIVVIGICLCLLPIVQIYRAFKIKHIQTLLSDTQQLFKYIQDVEVDKKIKNIKKAYSRIRDPLQQQSFKIGATTKSYKLLPNTSKPQINEIEGQKQILKYQSFIQTIVIIVLQIMVISVYFLLLFSYSRKIRNQFPIIVNYQQSLSVQHITLKTSLLTTYYNILYKEVKGQVLPSFLETTSLIDTTVLRSFNLPIFFNQYTESSWIQSNSDLCILSFHSSDKQKCKTIMGGILTSGASKTLDMFWDKLRQFQLKSLQSVYEGSLFQDLQFVETYLVQFIKSMRKQFQNLQQQYIHQTRSGFIIITLLGIIFAIISSCLGYYHKYQYNQKKSVCASLFNIFPEQGFRKQEVRNFLNKSNIIEKLGTL